MYKKILIALGVIILVVLGIVLINKNNNKELLHLSTKYYNKGEFVDITSDDLNKIKDENYIVFTYNTYCSFQIPCEEIFREFMSKYNIDFLYIPFDEFKNTYLYDTVKYAPSIIIVNNGKIVSYLDAESDEDLDRYQNVKEFTNWIKKYVVI